MPAFNAGSYIGYAVESILNQTYLNFELIIIDDFSADNTISIIESFVDTRIILLKNDSNKGIVYSLNRGISISKGTFIARMDADDISISNRLEIQLAQFLLNNRLVLCGSFYNVLYGNKVIRKTILPVKDEEIKKRMLFHNPICHPSVMFKRELWDLVKYKEENVGCEDYAFWLECSSFGEYYNIPFPLLLYRVHAENISLKSNSIRDLRLYSLLKINIKKYLGYDLLDKSLTSKDIINIIGRIKNDKLIFEGFIEYLLNYKLFDFSLFYKFGLNTAVTSLKVFLQIRISNFRYRLKIYSIERGSIFN